MSKFKKAKAVLLETEDLYVFSDDEINVGDYVYDAYDLLVYKIEQFTSRNAHQKKIIATNNTLLSEGYKAIKFQNNIIGESYHSIPQIPKDFIEFCLNSYTKYVIIDVLVEYETLKTTPNNKNFGEGHIYAITNNLNINQEDNSIIIKKDKDTWTREEMEQLLHQAVNDSHCGSNRIKVKIPNSNSCAEFTNKWIKDNL